jgi:hypothetical protein
MRHTRQGPTWWSTWLLLLLLVGLLGLEHQAPLSPGGHQVAQLVIVLFMYGLLLCWLWYNRGALVHEAYEREQAQGRVHKARQRRRELALSIHELWDDTWLSWQNNGHSTDIQRRW